MSIVRTAIRTSVLVVAVLAGGAVAPASAADPAADKETPVAVMTLSRALAIAVANQPTLRQARAATEAAAGRIDQAAAPGLPQITATANYQRTTGNFSPRPGSTSAAVQMAPPWSTQTFNYFNMGVTANQLITDFGQTSGRRQSAESNHRASEAAEVTADFNLRLQVKQAFFRGRAQKALVAVAQTAVANQQKHVDQIKSFVDAGLRPEIDLARVRTDLANARVALITAENGYDLAKAQLNQAMGVTSTAAYQIADDELPAVEGEDGPAARLLDETLAGRPEFLTLRHQREAQVQLVRGLKGGYGPALYATAGATEAGGNLDHLIPNWFLGATLSWPLLQGGMTRGQVREGEANLRVLEAQLEAQRLQVRLELEQALLAVRAAKASIVAVEEALTNAREQLRLADARYRTGLGNAIELSDAEQAFVAAGAQAVTSGYNLAIARAQLTAGLGRGPDRS